jgi:hypothetical protein
VGQVLNLPSTRQIRQVENLPHEFSEDNAMQKFFSWVLAALLVVGSAAFQPSAKVSGATASRPVAADDSVALLPKSDVVVVIDVNRLVNDIVPKVKQAWPTDFAKVEKELTEGMAKAKVDIYKIKTLSIGLKLFGDTTTGAMIVEGLPLTAEMTADTTSSSYKGKTLYVEKPEAAKAKAAAAGKAKPATGAKAAAEPSLTNVAGLAGSVGNSLLNQKTAFVQLDDARLAIGDESEVKTVIDALVGSPNDNNLGGDLAAALKETSTTGLIRLAVNVPDSLRQMAAGEDFLKNLAVTKMVLGTVDITSDLSLLLDAKLRTGSADDATKLHESLAALLGLGKMMLGGNQDPTMQMVTKLLDQIKLNLQAKDVALGLTVPREVFDLLMKPEPKAAPAKKEK